MLSCTNNSPALLSDLPHHGVDGKFKNTAQDFINDDADILALIGRYINEKRIDTEPTKPIPVNQLTSEQILTLGIERDSVVRLGHSSILLNMAGQHWLIDPVFSERASPFSFAGPKRFHQPPIDLANLPAIDGVIISHDHYDHLDKTTIKHLAQTVKHFVVPLGVERHLMNWGVDENTIHPLDWWQNINLGEIKITATPTQHFSGRGLFDKNKTLWASYAIKSTTSNIYFSGDSGYFDGFKVIGERLGPFDLTLVETGAYDKDWATIHMTPEQSLQAHIDLKGKHLLPIHNGTFDLAFHPWYEPLERITALANEANVSLITPVMGQVVDTDKPNGTTLWWRL